MCTKSIRIKVWGKLESDTIFKKDYKQKASSEQRSSVIFINFLLLQIDTFLQKITKEKQVRENVVWRDFIKAMSMSMVILFVLKS